MSFIKFLKVSNQDLGSTDISDFETTNNLILPPDYKSFLTETNGGVPINPYIGLYPIDKKYGIEESPNEIEIDSFLSINSLQETLDNLRLYTYSQDSPLPLTKNANSKLEDYLKQNLVPIAESYNDLIFIDTGGLYYGNIFYNNYDFGYLNIASSFSKLLEICYKNSKE